MGHLVRRRAGHEPGLPLPAEHAARRRWSPALNFNIFNRHADRVRMANIAQTINVLQAMILTDKEKMLLTPTYHVFEMFKVHQGGTLAAGGADVARLRVRRSEDPGRQRVGDAVDRRQGGAPVARQHRSRARRSR